MDFTLNINGKTVGDYTRLSWGGADRDAARSLAVSVPAACDCPLGAPVALYYRGRLIFSGLIWERERATNDPMLDLRAYDRGVYLKGNDTTVKWRGTPEGLARQLCRDNGIKAGALAATGVQIRRNFFGVDLYQAIMTGYTLASKQTGKRYKLRFAGDVLEVAVKAVSADSPRLEPGVNILRLSSGESLEGLVTEVQVYDDKHHRVAVHKGDPTLQRLYGRMVRHIRQDKDGQSTGEARQILEDGGVHTAISAECLGDIRLMAGTAVVVREPQTGTRGEFWITSDQHSVERGIYRTRVELDCRNLMDDTEAGSRPGKKG